MTLLQEHSDVEAAPPPSGLRVECETGPGDKIRTKIETAGAIRRIYEYDYDHRGRLTRARLNGAETEFYRYNHAGQRVLQQRSASSRSGAALSSAQADGALVYDSHGRLHPGRTPGVFL